MVIPLLSYSFSTQNQRVDGYEVPGDEQPRIYTTQYLLSELELDELIKAAYRQIFNEQQLLLSNRQICLESQLRFGQITVREFVRGLLLSDSFRRRNYEPNNNYRFVQMCIQRVWGREVYDNREKLAWSIVLATKGLQGFVDALLSSEEYLKNFGDDTVPYQRRRILPLQIQGDLPFARMPRYGADYRYKLEELGYFSHQAGEYWGYSRENKIQAILRSIFQNFEIERRAVELPQPTGFQISLLHPRRLAKGHSTTVTVQIYLPNQRADVFMRIEALRQRSIPELVENYSYSSSLIPGMTVIIKLFSPAINFSDEVLKELQGEYVNRITFTVEPDKECALGRQEAVLSIRDSETNKEYESIPFSFIVDDFAFDHVSKPTLSLVSSGVTGIGSLALFTLTFLQKVDATLGIPVGTVTTALALLCGFRTTFLYQNPVKTEGK